MRTFWILAYVLRVYGHKGHGGYVMWDSFKAKWTLGPRRLSEKFWSDTGPHIDSAIAAFPTAVIGYEPDKER